MKKIFVRKPVKYILKFLGIVILLYCIVTFILFCIRGNHFGGYYIYQEDGNQVLCYRDNFYVMVNDPKEIDKIYRLGIEGDGQWISTEDNLITFSPITFPFIEYWLPEIFFHQAIYLQHLNYSGEYLIVATLAGEQYYKKQ